MPEDRKAQVRSGMAERHRVLGENFSKTLQGIARERPVDLVCFTGDVADWGLKEEYVRVTERFESVLKDVGVARDRFFVVPGNHDIQRPEPGDEDAKRNFDRFRSLRAQT